MSDSFSAQDVFALLTAIHPLDRVPRAGYLLRGVTEPESVAAHSFSVALLTMLFTQAHPELFDGEKAISIALIHDVSESETMDIPMPAGSAEFKESKRDTEQSIVDRLFRSFGERYAEYHRELLDESTPEAKLVRALDKAQMMAKVALYEREGRGRLDDFWSNSANFKDGGFPFIWDLYETIAKSAGRSIPNE